MFYVFCDIWYVSFHHTGLVRNTTREMRRILCQERHFTRQKRHVNRDTWNETREMRRILCQERHFRRILCQERHFRRILCQERHFLSPRWVMGWLRLVGSIKLYVSFAEYGLFYRALLQKRPMFLRSLLVVATSYHRGHVLCDKAAAILWKSGSFHMRLISFDM